MEREPGQHVEEAPEARCQVPRPGGGERLPPRPRVDAGQVEPPQEVRRIGARAGVARGGELAIERDQRGSAPPDLQGEQRLVPRVVRVHASADAP